MLIHNMQYAIIQIMHVQQFVLVRAYGGNYAYPMLCFQQPVVLKEDPKNIQKIIARIEERYVLKYCV